MIASLKQHSLFKDKDIQSCTRLEHQGYCNENYLLVVDNQKYIVRQLVRSDIDRDFEYKVQHLAFEKGISAEPWVFDEKNSLMVFEFLEGVHKSVLDRDDLIHLAQTLRLLHSIEVDNSAIELHLANHTDEITAAFEILDTFPKEYVLCHNDLNPKNIFFTHKVKLIDFEYAGVNDRYFDLACICVEFGLDAKMQEILLNTYFENEKAVVAKLEAYKTIYLALCRQWFENN